MEQTLGKRIVYHRKRLKLTQDQLAERLGVTAQAVSKWENDQSCPDITTLPLLAEIFGVSIDSLLGKEPLPVPAPPAAEQPREGNFQVKTGDWEFTYDSGRLGAVGLAVFVLLLGALLLAAKLLKWEVTFWELFWPTALIVGGVFGLLKKFSFLWLGGLLCGAYLLLSNLSLLPFTLDKDLILPALLVLLGLSLLTKALKRPKKPYFHFHHGKDKKDQQLPTHELELGDDRFSWSASFGESTQRIELQTLAFGEVNVNFGEYTLDLTGVEQVSPDCRVNCNGSFGELRVLVPSRFAVKHSSATAFASVGLHGHHQPEPEGTILLSADASFGEISIHYV